MDTCTSHVGENTFSAASSEASSSLSDLFLWDSLSLGCPVSPRPSDELLFFQSQTNSATWVLGWCPLGASRSPLSTAHIMLHTGSSLLTPLSPGVSKVLEGLSLCVSHQQFNSTCFLLPTTPVMWGLRIWNTTFSTLLIQRACFPLNHYCATSSYRLSMKVAENALLCILIWKINT